MQEGTFEATWEWLGPDWADMNNLDTSPVGFVQGEGLGDNGAQLDEFIAGLADGSINLFTGPLNYQDGTALAGRRRDRHRPPDLVHRAAARGHGGSEHLELNEASGDRPVTPLRP